MIDALIQRVSVTYKCYEMYAHRGKIRATARVLRSIKRCESAFSIDLVISLQANNLTSLFPYATDLTSDR
jgi:hypothetical protein